MYSIDLTRTFTVHMPTYPGDPEPELRQIASLAGDGHVDHRLATGLHVGTHMDGPLHMLPAGKPLSDFAPDRFFGRGHLIDARGRSVVGPELLVGEEFGPGDIVAVLTGWGRKYGQPDYFRGYPEISKRFAEALAGEDVSVLCLDTPSPDSPPFEIHKFLLKCGVLIVENVANLETLLFEDAFELVALPLRLSADSAPCRVVARMK